MNKKSLWIVGIIAIILILAYFFVGNAESGDTIEIGSILILSGPGASWGTSEQNGINMAVKDINDDGGINGKKLIVNHQDDQSNPTQAINAFRHLTDVVGVNIIIGTTWTHTGLPLVDLAKEKNILMISPSLGDPSFNEADDLLFNTWPHDIILSSGLADYVYEKGHRNIALIGAEQIWVKGQTNAFIGRFEELGGTVKVKLEPLPDTTDVSSEALKIKNKENEIDAIISTTDGILVGALIAKRVRELGVDLPIYSITIGKEDVAASQGAYEGLEFLTFLTYTDEFANKYDEKYGLENLDIGAPSAYDAVMLLAQAMRETDSTDSTVLSEYLNSIETYDGASLTLTSDGKGGFVKDYAIKKVVNGKIIDLE